MVLSMTGFGKAESAFRAGKLVCEVKSLNNSKGFDARARVPNIFSSYDLEIRKLAQQSAQRGKLDISINLIGEDDGSYSIDENLFKQYYRHLVELQRDLKIEIPAGHMAQSIMRIPSVLGNADVKLNQSEEDVLFQTVEHALDQLESYRRTEGESLYKDLKDRAESILQKLQEVVPHEKERDQYFRERLWSLLSDRMQNEEIDKNRFEQEVLFYLDKLDISEEKVRLEQHCSFFLEQLEGDQAQKGRKLNFISQEMGREINTLGSKAQNSAIQHIVVGMKEDLEKIKEQIANVV